MSDDLTEFLRARFAEDEAVARNATPGTWYADDLYSTVTAEPFKSAREAYDRDLSSDVDCWVIPESMDSGVGEHNLTHIARHDPARVLAECEAKRKRVELFAHWDRLCPPGDWPDVSDFSGAALADAGRHLLRVEALPYADHPDYREEWRV